MVPTRDEKNPKVYGVFTTTRYFFYCHHWKNTSVTASQEIIPPRALASVTVFTTLAALQCRILTLL